MTLPVLVYYIYELVVNLVSCPSNKKKQHVNLLFTSVGCRHTLNQNQHTAALGASQESHLPDRRTPLSIGARVHKGTELIPLCLNIYYSLKGSQE